MRACICGRTPSALVHGFNVFESSSIWGGCSRIATASLSRPLVLFRSAGIPFCLAARVLPQVLRCHSTSGYNSIQSLWEHHSYDWLGSQNGSIQDDKSPHHRDAPRCSTHKSLSEATCISPATPFHLPWPGNIVSGWSWIGLWIASWEPASASVITCVNWLLSQIITFIRLFFASFANHKRQNNIWKQPKNTNGWTWLLQNGLKNCTPLQIHKIPGLLVLPALVHPGCQWYFRFCGRVYHGSRWGWCNAGPAALSPCEFFALPLATNPSNTWQPVLQEGSIGRNWRAKRPETCWIMMRLVGQLLILWTHVHSRDLILK